MITKKMNANSDNASQTIVSPEYLVGALETDGTVLMSITKSGKKTIKPEIRFSSKSNTNTLKLFADFCKEIGLNPRYEKGVQSIPGKNPGRAPCYKVGGKNQVLTLIKALKKSKMRFTGQKQRDFLLLETALTETLSDAQKLAIKKSLHKNNRNDPDLKTSRQTKSREDYEKDMDIPLNSSYTDGEQLLAAIDAKCDQRKKELQKVMKDGTLNVPPDYLKGLIDGDGSIGIAISIKDREKPRITMEFGVNISLAIDGQSKILTDIFKYAFQSKAQVKAKQSLKNPGQITAYTVSLRNQTENQQVFDFYKKHGPPLGDLRKHQLEIALELMKIKHNGDLRNYGIMEPFIDKLYEFSALILKGKQRTCKDDVLKALRNYCRDI